MLSPLVLAGRRAPRAGRRRSLSLPVRSSGRTSVFHASPRAVPARPEPLPSGHARQRQTMHQVHRQREGVAERLAPQRPRHRTSHGRSCSIAAPDVQLQRRRTPSRAPDPSAPRRSARARRRTAGPRSPTTAGRSPRTRRPLRVQMRANSSRTSCSRLLREVLRRRCSPARPSSGSDGPARRATRPPGGRSPSSSSRRSRARSDTRSWRRAASRASRCCAPPASAARYDVVIARHAPRQSSGSSRAPRSVGLVVRTTSPADRRSRPCDRAAARARSVPRARRARRPGSGGCPPPNAR